jgi:phosphatidylinositol glycan class A protein
MPMVDQDAMPTFSATLPLIRHILIRERIQIVHAHQATSTMANESVVYAAALNIPSVYTDHSLFGFNDVASVILNRVLQTTLSTVDAAICVSHTCRDNLILRAKLDPQRVHVIPNAVDPTKFTPDPSKRHRERIIVVVISRLVYRKGVDLLVGIIPRICKEMDNVDFIIGGDGNKRLALQEMVEQERLQERVSFLGALPHSQVRNVLCQGHIFLNCSLTESFCIALLEAACCGLLAVSTNVGGVPEVLPNDMVFLAEPSVATLVEKLKQAILRQQSDKEAADPFEFHRRVKDMYSWKRVASETSLVYEEVIQRQRLSLRERLQCYASLGGIAGLVACFLVLTLEVWLRVVEKWQPRHTIDVVPDLADPSGEADRQDEH